MSETKIKPGDVYCPRCGVGRIELQYSNLDLRWDCSSCGEFDWPFEALPDGTFNWLWDETHPPANPGCPWCQSRNISFGAGVYGMFAVRCYRQSCSQNWVGTWTRKGNDWRTDRWLIRVRVEEVPWVSGTTADLECYRRVSGGLRTDHNSHFPACCRWPKECRAYDAGFTTGKGPTELPIVWNDGFGWRSGPPDVTKIPEHLFIRIWERWLLASGWGGSDVRD